MIEFGKIISIPVLPWFRPGYPNFLMNIQELTIVSLRNTFMEIIRLAPIDHLPVWDGVDDTKVSLQCRGCGYRIIYNHPDDIPDEDVPCLCEFGHLIVFTSTFEDGDREWLAG